jgi:FkbM family methyltransferase
MRSRARGLVNEVGYDVHKVREEPVHRATTLPSADEAVARVFELAQPRSVIDVGANIGQVTEWARGAGFTGQIISIEPQPAEHAQLVAAAAGDPNWTVAPRCAVGAADGIAQINIAGNSQSSSLLDMLEVHAANAPNSVYVDSAETPVRKLDDVLAEAGFDATGALLTIDTQGFESEVLRGAQKTLPLVAAAMLEISLAPLYDGQALASELFGQLGAAGLELTVLASAFNTPGGDILQVDGGFTRLGEFRKS